MIRVYGFPGRLVEHHIEAFTRALAVHAALWDILSKPGRLDARNDHSCWLGVSAELLGSMSIRIVAHAGLAENPLDQSL